MGSVTVDFDGSDAAPIVEAVRQFVGEAAFSKRKACRVRPHVLTRSHPSAGSAESRTSLINTVELRLKRLDPDMAEENVLIEFIKCREVSQRSSEDIPYETQQPSMCEYNTRMWVLSDSASVASVVDQVTNFLDDPNVPSNDLLTLPACFSSGLTKYRCMTRNNVGGGGTTLISVFCNGFLQETLKKFAAESVPIVDTPGCAFAHQTVWQLEYQDFAINEGNDPTLSDVSPSRRFMIRYVNDPRKNVSIVRQLEWCSDVESFSVDLTEPQRRAVFHLETRRSSQSHEVSLRPDHVIQFVPMITYIDSMELISIAMDKCLCDAWSFLPSSSLDDAAESSVGGGAASSAGFDGVAYGETTESAAGEASGESAGDN